MSLILELREDIKNYGKNMQTEDSSDDIKKIRFQENKTLAIPGYFKCQYSDIGFLRNSLMNVGMNKDVKSMLLFAEKVVIGADDENEGRTYFQELERTLKDLKANGCVVTKDIGFFPDKMYWEYPLINEALEFMDALYWTFLECGTETLEKEGLLDYFLYLNGKPYWYNFFASTDEIVKMYEIVMDIYGKEFRERIDANIEL